MNSRASPHGIIWPLVPCRVALGAVRRPFYGAGDRPRQLARHHRQPECSGASTVSLGRCRIVPLQPGAHQPGQALYVVRGTVQETVATLPGGRARAQVSFQYSLDASTIKLCLSAFPWADFQTTKGAVKLHVGLNHRGCLPEFVTITDGKTSDIAIGRTLRFPKGSLVAIDRGYNDYDWYKQLNDNDTFFVTRIKKATAYRVVGRADVLKSKGLTCDQRIVFTGVKASRQYPIPLRRIGYLDADTGKHYVFLTNNFKLAAKTIADLYKARWQVELFFKWIKQNLKIKSFIGTSHNAVMTQIWIALCVYLLLAFIKFQSRLGKSMHVAS